MRVSSLDEILIVLVWILALPVTAASAAPMSFWEWVSHWQALLAGLINVAVIGGIYLYLAGSERRRADQHRREEVHRLARLLRTEIWIIYQRIDGLKELLESENNVPREKIPELKRPFPIYERPSLDLGLLDIKSVSLVLKFYDGLREYNEYRADLLSDSAKASRPMGEQLAGKMLVRCTTICDYANALMVRLHAIENDTAKPPWPEDLPEFIDQEVET